MSEFKKKESSPLKKKSLKRESGVASEYHCCLIKLALGLLHWLIEKGFGRFQWIKNNPRSNFLLLRSIWSTSVIFFPLVGCLYLVDAFPKEVDAFELALFFCGGVSALFWNMTNLYNAKWRYCANQYNDIIRFDYDRYACSNCKKKKGEEECPNVKNKKDLLNNAFALDLLKLDFWAHTSFWEVFSSEIKKACDESESKCFCDIKSETDAQEILDRRHRKIHEQTKEECGHNPPPEKKGLARWI